MEALRPPRGFGARYAHETPRYAEGTTAPLAPATPTALSRMSRGDALKPAWEPQAAGDSANALKEERRTCFTSESLALSPHLTPAASSRRPEMLRRARSLLRLSAERCSIGHREGVCGLSDSCGALKRCLTMHYSIATSSSPPKPA